MEKKTPTKWWAFSSSGSALRRKPSEVTLPDERSYADYCPFASPPMYKIAICEEK